MPTLLDRLRSATAGDLDRDAADVIGLRPGETFAVSRDGLRVGAETVPFGEALAEVLRVLDGRPEPAGPPPRIRILDLGGDHAP